MKLNEKILKALQSGQVILLSILLLALIILMAVFPNYSWIMMSVGSIFIILILVVALASGFNNTEEILKDK